MYILYKYTAYNINYMCVRVYIHAYRYIINTLYNMHVYKFFTNNISITVDRKIYKYTDT